MTVLGAPTGSVHRFSFPLGPGLLIMMCSREAHVDGGGCEVLLFEEEPIAKNDSAVKTQSRFRAIPPNECVDGMTV